MSSMKGSVNKILTFTIFLIFSVFSRLNALSLTDFSSTMSTIFQDFYGDNEGTTSFHSLLIPIGGRAESLGSAYTGLCDDASYINFNPAAACVLKNTEAGVYHNSWIADSQMETLSYTTRFRNFGLGTQLSCFYVPFSEYNLSGERTTTGYYSESTLALNAAYNFLAGYDFKGLAAGVSFKTSMRSVPDFTDNDTNEIIKNSGLSQSAVAFMLDAGLLLQFDLVQFKQILFYSRDPNVKIGFSIQNFGLGITGFGDKICLDDPLPTYIAAGLSLKFLPFMTVAADFKQPVNLQHITKSSLFSAGIGTTIDFTKNFSVLAGFELKGGNPRLSAGAEAEINNIRFNFNYTLDLTTSANPINRISLSAQFMLGDRGRQAEQDIIDQLYLEGVRLYAAGQWQAAIDSWNQIITKYNKRYDPALAGIESAQAQLDMLKKARESMFFNDEETEQN